MRNHRAQEWELRLKSVFDEIDQELENTYGHSFHRHPSRPARNSTCNPEMDGLFNVGASYSAGFGSHLGPGYVVEIRISTLERIPNAMKKELKAKVKALLKTKLPTAFPDTTLTVHEEHEHLRITGDLSLD